jgi:hypothetical protein
MRDDIATLTPLFGVIVGMGAVIALASYLVHHMPNGALFFLN